MQSSTATQSSSSAPVTPVEDGSVDVAICGGGMAGLTLARQIRREVPDLRVAVIEPTRRPLPPAAHKVGESSVELGSMYLDRLGLHDYMVSEHVIKFGLRFFPGGGHLPIEQRVEIGAGGDAFIDSYQMDRGKFEADLRGLIQTDGVALYEGARVTAVDLAPGEAPHTVHVEQGDRSARLTARWVVDATGRRALLRRQLGSTQPAEHVGNAGWFRLSGRFDISKMATDSAWWARPRAAERWRSTNHFMGEGYWVWIIPLPDDRTSIGIVTHASTHGFDTVRSLDACWAFLDTHEPVLAAALRAHLDGDAVLDFRCLKHFSHDADRTLSADRWALVGEAGPFIDPLYSPGADMIALANSHVVEMLRADLDGRDLVARAAELDDHFQTIIRWGFEIFAQAAPVYGYAPAMTAKYYWDNFVYWSFHCEYFAQGIQRLTGPDLAAFVPVRDGYRAVNLKVQTLLHHWARLALDRPDGRFMGVPALNSILIESYMALLTEMEPEDTLEFMTLRLKQAHTLLGELVLRALGALGPAQGATLIERTGLRGWGLAITDRRLSAEGVTGKARRAKLGRIGRDVEDHTFPLTQHPAALAAMRLACAP